MGACKAARCRRRYTRQEKVAEEARIKAACAWLRKTISTNYAEAARKFHIVSYHKLRRQQEQDTREKEAREEAKKMEKQRKAEALQVHRADLAKQGDAVRFTKALSSCNRPELESVAFVLGLAFNQDNKKLLLSDIVGHFDKHPELKNDPRFTRMFTRCRVVSASGMI